VNSCAQRASTAFVLSGLAMATRLAGGVRAGLAAGSAMAGSAIAKAAMLIIVLSAVDARR